MVCNTKGWDIISKGTKYTIKPHSCREYGECGHEDNHIDNTVDRILELYKKQFSYITNLPTDLIDTELLIEIVSDMLEWKNKTHPDYIYYTR